MNTVTTTRTIDVPGIGPVDVSYVERGRGRAYLLLHGGAGPFSVAGFADLLAAIGDAAVLVPTHPGFSATPRPDTLTSVRGLAALYVGLLDDLDLRDVTVVGNSIGGWIAAEMALLDSDRVARVVLVDAVGVVVDGYSVADVFTMDIGEVMKLSYFDPQKFLIDPSTIPEAQRAVIAGNFATLRVYAGESSMGDATLLARLEGIDVATLVLWGEADRIAEPGYGRAFANAIPGAHFRVLPSCGHLPQIETPQQLLDEITDFAGH
jgi:pimeloyl-ACP methyl ester carboxylesterase